MMDGDNRPLSEQYGKLTFLRNGEPRIYTSGMRATGIFRCECGTEKELEMSRVRTGKTLSCGCYHAEKMALLRTTHGNTGGDEYNTWSHMIQRCHNPKNTAYERYGGRGVSVCDEWRKDFAAFLQHVGKRPSKLHSIDRINNDVGYCPGNVRWATAKEQSRNKRSCIMIEHNGTRMVLKDYCRAVGLSYHTAQYRLHVLGWDLSKTIEVRDGRR